MAIERQLRELPAVRVSWGLMYTHVRAMEFLISERASHEKARPYIWGVPMNGTIIASLISKRMEIPMLQHPEMSSAPWMREPMPDKFESILAATTQRQNYDDEMLVVVDDIAHTGETIDKVRKIIEESRVATWDHIMYLTMYKRAGCPLAEITGVVSMKEGAPQLILPWEDFS